MAGLVIIAIIVIIGVIFIWRRKRYNESDNKKPPTTTPVSEDYVEPTTDPEYMELNTSEITRTPPIYEHVNNQSVSIYSFCYNIWKYLYWSFIKLL